MFILILSFFITVNIKDIKGAIGELLQYTNQGQACNENDNTDNQYIGDEQGSINCDSSQISDNIGSTANEQDNEISNTQNDSTKNVSNNEEVEEKVVEKQGLVELIKLDDSFVIDLKYATEDNFTGKRIYTQSKCLIHKNTAKKLIDANNEFKKLGYRIKIFDAYRPYSAQQILWDAAQDKSFVANPKKGSIHNRGAAVDVTLVDADGNELEMPSSYDEFSKRARIDFKECSDEIIKNRELLGEIMIKHGFKRISSEWWHFDDVDGKNHPILDIPFEDF